MCWGVEGVIMVVGYIGKGEDRAGFENQDEDAAVGSNVEGAAADWN